MYDDVSQINMCVIYFSVLLIADPLEAYYIQYTDYEKNDELTMSRANKLKSGRNDNNITHDR